MRAVPMTGTERDTITVPLRPACVCAGQRGFGSMLISRLYQWDTMDHRGSTIVDLSQAVFPGQRGCEGFKTSGTLHSGNYQDHVPLKSVQWDAVGHDRCPTQKGHLTRAFNHKHASCGTHRDINASRSLGQWDTTFRECPTAPTGRSRTMEATTTTKGKILTNEPTDHFTDPIAGSHVLDVIRAAGKPLTITDIAARLFANPTLITPIVIEGVTLGALTSTTEPVGNGITITKYGLAGGWEEQIARIAGSVFAAPARGRASAYPGEGRHELRAQNGAERLRGR